MKDGIENSWVPLPGFEPQPSAQQASILSQDHSAAVVLSDVGVTGRIPYISSMSQTGRFAIGL